MRCKNHPMVEMKVAIHNGAYIIYYCPQCNDTVAVKKEDLKQEDLRKADLRKES